MKFLQYLRYLPWVIVILAISAVAIWQWRASVANQQLLTAKATELQQANLEVGKAHTQMMAADALNKKAMAELDSKLKAQISIYNALVTEYTTLEAQYKAEKAHSQGLIETVEELKKITAVADLPSGKLFYKKDDGTLAQVNTLKWTFSDFRMDLDGAGTPDGLNPDQTIHIKHDISYKLHMKFKAQIVEATMPNGVANHYAKLFELGPKDEVMGELPLTSFEVIQSEKIPAKMMWWDPKIDLFLGGGITQRISPEWLGEVGISMSAYGKTKDDISWRFFRVGTGITSGERFSLTFSPAQYNIAKHLPLVSNLWITPYLGYIPQDGLVHAGAGISVVF